MAPAWGDDHRLQLREDKVNLERAHEEESESTVNRLSRELTALRLQQIQLNGSQAEDGNRNNSFRRRESDAPDPSTEILLEAMKRENENLRSRLVATERDYVRITRLNEIYREELIQHRRRVRHSAFHLRHNLMETHSVGSSR